MQAAIAQLEIYLDTLENNAPSNEREGNLEQAQFERSSAAEVREAIVWLRRRDELRTGLVQCEDPGDFVLYLAEILGVDLKV